MPSRKPASGPELSPALRYLGDDSGVPHISGVPSRDLSAGDVRRFAQRLGMTVPAFIAAASSQGVFTEAAPAIPAANSSADDSGKE